MASPSKIEALRKAVIEQAEIAALDAVQEAVSQPKPKKPMQPGLVKRVTMEDNAVPQPIGLVAPAPVGTSSGTSQWLDKKRKEEEATSDQMDIDDGASTAAPSASASSAGDHVYACMECKTEVYKSGFLLNDGGKSLQDHDWAGQFWGKCVDCSHLPLKEFKKAVKAAWKANAEQRGIRWERLQGRVKDMNDSFAYIDAKYEGTGLNSKQRRDLAKLRVNRFCVAFAAGMKSATKQTKQAYIKIYEEYKTDCESGALDPFAPGTKRGGNKLGHQADWLTEVNRGLSVSYACRFKTCRWYGCNDQWIADLNLTHFRCPMCILQYQPSSERLGQLPYQKAVHIVGPDGDVSVFPCRWPGTEEDDFLMKCAETYAANLTTDKELEEFSSNAVWELDDLLKKIRIPEGMRKFEWDSSKEYMLSHKWPQEGPFGWERLRGGYYGGIVPDAPNGDWVEYTFVDWQELVAGLGSCIYAGNQIAAKL